MKERSFDEMIAYFNRRVADMDISQDCKMELLGMVTALGYKHEKSAQQWIPCSERLPDEDYWTGGTGEQFSATVLVTVSNREDEVEWIDVSYTVDGEWMLELPMYCNIVAWMPIPEPWRGEDNDS